MESVSRTDSASTEADLFRGRVEDLMLEDVVTEIYVERAATLIFSLAARDNPNEFCPKWYTRCKAQFDVILSTMLLSSAECGGPDDYRAEGSQRYVACAIIASTSGTKDSDDIHRALSELALTWFSNLLWICEYFVLFLSHQSH
jgi:hypothetical protein